MAPKRDETDQQRLVQGAPHFGVAPEYQGPLAEMGLASLDAVFAFDRGKDLAKPQIGRFRRRLVFEVKLPTSPVPRNVFLKRYDRPPVLKQIRNWLSHLQRKSFGLLEHDATERLAAAGVNTPRTVACGQEWGLFFERRSFFATEEVADSDSLERRLPDCFDAPATTATLRERRAFIVRLARFVRRFHETGYRHRDLYFSHIFCSRTGKFCLIDLARASRPFRQNRYQIKDIAQLHYSAPAGRFSRTDRLRFLLCYLDRQKLHRSDRVFIRKVLRKADRMARHNRKHGIRVPFQERPAHTC